MWRLACLVNWLAGGRYDEPLCSRIERGWLDRHPVARALYRVVNWRNPLRSARVRCDYLERQ